MVICNECSRKCKKASTNGATVVEMELEMKNHDCSFPDRKSFEPEVLKKREIECTPRLVYNSSGRTV